MHDLFHAAFVETNVCDSISACALQCIVHCSRMTFDTDNFFTEACEVLTNRAHTTIGIEHRIALRELCSLRNRHIELFGGKRVRLEEGEWRNFEREIEQAFGNRRLANKA